MYGCVGTCQLDAFQLDASTISFGKCRWRRVDQNIEPLPGAIVCNIDMRESGQDLSPGDKGSLLKGMGSQGPHFKAQRKHWTKT